MNPFPDKVKMKRVDAERAAKHNIANNLKMATEALNALPYGAALCVMRDVITVTHPNAIAFPTREFAHEIDRHADQIDRDNGE